MDYRLLVLGALLVAGGIVARRRSRWGVLATVNGAVIAAAAVVPTGVRDTLTWILVVLIAVDLVLAGVAFFAALRRGRRLRTTEVARLETLIKKEEP